jgi:excisionase family DNA binding protein
VARRYLTTEEVSAQLRTPLSTLYYWRTKGTGPKAVRVGKRLLYSDAAVQRFLAERAEAEQKRQAPSRRRSRAR